jgi:3-isopropylmalate dehydratase small subunit
MAVSNQPVGVDHVTVVPENFEVGSEREHAGDSGDDAEP